MYLCNEQLTIYNRYTDAITKSKVYLPTVIKGIHWFGTEKVSVTSDGLVGAKQYTVRIPEGADFSGSTYLPPKEYAKLEDHTGHFTITEGDIVVKGIAVEEGREAKPDKLQSKYNEVFTVISVTDNRNAPNAKHWKVVGK